jgi:hypothetical protein
MISVREKTDNAFESSDVRKGRFIRHGLNVNIAVEDGN